MQSRIIILFSHIIALCTFMYIRITEFWASHRFFPVASVVPTSCLHTRTFTHFIEIVLLKVTVYAHTQCAGNDAIDSWQLTIHHIERYIYT